MVLAEALLFSFILLQAKKRRESSSMIPLPFLVDNRVLVLRQELQSLKKSRQAQLTAYAEDLRQQTLQYAAVRQDFLQAAGTGNHVSVYKQALREVCTTEVITNAILRKLTMLLFLSHHLEVLKQNTTFLEMQTTEIQQYLENQKLQLMNQQTDMARDYREKIKKLEQETYLLQQEYENKLQAQEIVLTKLHRAPTRNVALEQAIAMLDDSENNSDDIVQLTQELLELDGTFVTDDDYLHQVHQASHQEKRQQARRAELEKLRIQYAEAREEFLATAGRGNHLSVYKVALRQVLGEQRMPDLKPPAMLLFLSHHVDVLMQATHLAKKYALELELHLVQCKLDLQQEREQMVQSYQQELLRLQRETQEMANQYQHRLDAQHMVLYKLQKDKSPKKPSPQNKQFWSVRNVALQDALSKLGEHHSHPMAHSMKQMLQKDDEQEGGSLAIERVLED